MASVQRVSHILAVLLLALPLAAIAQPDAPAGPDALLQRLDQYPHAQQVSASRREVLDHEVGLGAIQKVRGNWRMKDSERLSGELASYTWQILDGFSSAEVSGELEAAVAESGVAELLFACESRGCGPGVQWANRVFRQRILYGREDLQRYRVYRLEGDHEYRLIIYSSARTIDRQYLHVELLRVAPPA